MFRTMLCVAVALLCCADAAMAKGAKGRKGPTPAIETGKALDKDQANGEAKHAPIPQDEKMQWWRDARFGMFIHWGTYAVLGGVWKGLAWQGV